MGKLGNEKLDAVDDDLDYISEDKCTQWSSCHKNDYIVCLMINSDGDSQ